MAKIIIKRKKSMLGCLQNHDVYLNDTFAGELKNGGTLEILVKTGSYRLSFNSKMKRMGKNATFTVAINDIDEVVELKTKFAMSGEYVVENADKKPHNHLTANTSNIRPKTAPKDNQGAIIMPNRSDAPPQQLYASSDKKRQDEATVFFKNGVLYDVSPRNKHVTLDEDRDVAYNARFIISDGVKYDLEDAESIRQIKIPKFNSTKGMPYLTRDMGYLLRMCAGNDTRTNLTVPLIYKAVNIMIASPINYGKKDYFRLVARLWELGEFTYGDHLYAELKRNLPDIMSDHALEIIHKNAFKQALKTAKELNEDYLLSSDSRCVCEKCAPYCNRVYCISGKDTRFPKLPDFILKQSGLDCVDFSSLFYYKGCTITVYNYDENGNVFEKEVDAIKHSNRPFIDDRNAFEKETYERHSFEKAKRQKTEENYYDREHWVQKYYAAVEYQKITELLGDKAPKNLSGYIRMKNSNSANFQKLAKIAAENGINIY